MCTFYNKLHICSSNWAWYDSLCNKWQLWKWVRQVWRDKHLKYFWTVFLAFFLFSRVGRNTFHSMSVSSSFNSKKRASMLTFSCCCWKCIARSFLGSKMVHAMLTLPAESPNRRAMLSQMFPMYGTITFEWTAWTSSVLFSSGKFSFEMNSVYRIS